MTTTVFATLRKGAGLEKSEWLQLFRSHVERCRREIDAGVWVGTAVRRAPMVIEPAVTRALGFRRGKPFKKAMGSPSSHSYVIVREFVRTRSLLA